MEPDVQICKVTAILPLCPFPPLHWWFLAQGHHGGAATIATHEPFVKQSFRNRLKLAQADGPFTVTFPVIPNKNNDDNPIHQTLLSSHIKPVTLWRSLQTAYGSAPFFEHLAPDLEALWFEHLPQHQNDGKSLAAWSKATLHWMSTTCKWQLPRFSTEPIPFQSQLDLRERHNLRGQNWVFKRYRQLYDDRQPFIEGLSGLDALFVLGPQELNERLPELVQPLLRPDEI
jgi:hypothetical protein